jgi:hypothetical protein
METKSKRDEVIEIVNKLFIYTDSRQWQALLQEVFKENIFFDMSSMSGQPGSEMKASAICDAWKEGFKDIDAVQHLAGNYLVRFKEEETKAEVLCYANAVHYRQAAKNDKTREFVGSYDIHLVLTDYGWRIDRFKYNLKFIKGNQTLS